MNPVISHTGVYGLIIKNSKVVLVQKSRGPYKGLWDLPGGKPELFETKEEALKREIQEETGIKILTFKRSFFVSTSLDYEGTRFHHNGTLYTIEEFDDHGFTSSAKEDVSQAAWLATSELKTIGLTPFACFILQIALSNRHLSDKLQRMSLHAT